MEQNRVQTWSPSKTKPNDNGQTEIAPQMFLRRHTRNISIGSLRDIEALQASETKPTELKTPVIVAERKWKSKKLDWDKHREQYKGKARSSEELIERVEMFYGTKGVGASSTSTIKPEWIPDQSVHHCTLCSSQFTAFLRKHHCRNCGSVVCGECSSQTANLEHLGFKGKERVCDTCYLQLKKPFRSKSMTDVPTENINFGLAHSFSLTTVPNLGSQCAYCKSTVLELQYYSCSTCKYTAHKKCIHLVPNTCASKGEKEGSVVKLPQKEIEKLHSLWKSKEYGEGITKTQFDSFFRDCIEPVLSSLDPNPFENFVFATRSNQLFNFLDKNHDNCISFEEFILFVSTIKNLEPEDEIQISFLMYDNKGSGSLSKDELTQALSTKGSNGFFKLTDSLTLVECIVEEIFEASNVPLDKTISVNDILTAYKSDSTILTKFSS